MKILLRTGIDWDETQSILNKVNQFHEKPNNFVKACVEGDSVVFYTVEGNEVLFAQKADVLQGWEKRFPSYVGVLDMEHHTFDFSVFSELHTHSEFSILDGANRIGDIAAKYPYSGAITDHGVLYGWVEFFQKMRDAHKHPLMGCEVYTKGIDGDEGKYHLILLAKDTIGANNLIRISSEAQEHENYGGKFPQRPLVSYEMLEHYHEGLVCLSACIGGEIPRTILADDSNKTRRVIEKFKELFGEDFYLEIQRHADPKTLEQRIKKVCKMTPAVARADALRDKDGFIDKFGKYIYQDLFYEEQERKVNDALIQYADEYGIKLVATNDAHYLNKEDASTHEALLCNQRQDTMDNIKHWYFSGSGYYIHSSEEMEEQWADMPEVLANTLEVAEKCQYEMEFGNYHLPKFEIPAPFKSEFDYLKARTYEGFHQRYDGTPEEKDPVRLERLEYELSVIEKMGYASYFLIVWDFIHFAKTHGIAVGPGRGSAAGSLVCYCLRITELDPIPYDLLFERFLNPDRVSMPDIDIDFQDDRREEVVDYCKAKYGEKSVASIITFGTMAARKVVEDMCRVYNISDSFAKPNKFAEYIKAFIPMDPKITLKKALEENPEFQAAYDENENVKFIVDESMKLEGLKRNISTHACGKVICDGDINQYCPTVSVYDKDTSQWQKTAAWNMTEIEEVGLLKMDFLGLKTMTILDESVKTINYFEGSDLTIDNIPLYDVESYEFLAKGNTVGVFQLESPGMTSFIMQLFQDVEKRRKEIEAKHCSDDIKKEELENFGKELFERLIAGISLYRPGPMDSIPEYLAGMVSGVIHYDTPELETILESTYGQLVYQEQVILAVQKLAGFSASQADVVRKAMGKKKQYILDEYKPYFIYGSGDKRDEHTGKLMDIPGCIANGISETVATTIWNKMEAFGRYAFNKSHSAAYAVNSVKTAWCATHYPEIFHKSLMNVFISRPDKVKVYLADAIRMNIKVLPPSVNYSNRNFTMSGGTQIRFGLEGIKKVKKLAEKIIQEHSIRGSFSSFQNFVERMMIYQSLNRGAIESLIYAGAMDDFNGTRKAKISMIEDLMNAIRSGVEFQVKGQRTIFDLDPSLNKMKEFEIPDIEDYEKNTKFFKEEEMTGLFITGHPMEDFEKGLSAYQVLPLSTFADKEEDETEGTTENMYLGKNVRVAGIIYNLERKITSRGDRMFTFDLKDRAGEIRCVVFAKTADKYDDSIFQEKQMVVIGGKFEQNDFGSQVIVSNLIEIHNLPDSIRSISCTCFSNAKYAKVDYLTAFKDLAKANPGNATFEAKIDGVHYKLPCIHVSYPLFAKLQQIAGEDAVSAM